MSFASYAPSPAHLGFNRDSLRLAANEKSLVLFASNYFGEFSKS